MNLLVYGNDMKSVVLVGFSEMEINFANALMIRCPELFALQEVSAPKVDGNDPGHIISTTIGGKNGEPKRVGLEISCWESNCCGFKC